MHDSFTMEEAYRLCHLRHDSRRLAFRVTPLRNESKPKNQREMANEKRRRRYYDAKHVAYIRTSRKHIRIGPVPAKIEKKKLKKKGQMKSESGSSSCCRAGKTTNNRIREEKENEKYK